MWRNHHSSIGGVIPANGRWSIVTRIRLPGKDWTRVVAESVVRNG